MLWQRQWHWRGPCGPATWASRHADLAQASITGVISSSRSTITITITTINTITTITITIT